MVIIMNSRWYEYKLFVKLSVEENTDNHYFSPDYLMPMSFNVLSVFKFILIILETIFQSKNSQIWGVRFQEGNIAGRFFSSLRRGDVLPFSHMSTVMNKMI